MSDVKEPTDKSKGRKPLVLKRTVETGAVRQSFSHGRSKSVVVEKKRKRVLADGPEAAAPPAAEPRAAPTPPAAPAANAPTPEKRETSKPAVAPTRAPRRNTSRGGAGAAPGPQGVRSLSQAELDARRRALAASQAQLEERRRKEEEEAAARAKREQEEREALEARRRAEAEAEAEAQRQRDEEERRKKRTRDAEAAPAPMDAPPADPEAAAAAAAARARAKEKDAGKPAEGDEDALSQLGGRVKSKKTAVAKAVGKPKEPRRRTGKLTITTALQADEERQRSLASVKRAREREKRAAAERREQPAKVVREVVIPETITIQELAQRMAARAADVIKYLMKQGQMATINDVLEADEAQLIAEEFGHSVKRVSEADVEQGLIGGEDDADDMQSRPPVVTVMGHVDHGKTSLLDAMRQTDVVSREAGGITQHIGAYQITAPSGGKITFLDTPGHAAFTSMRARGATVTDIVILVVAADDGVMPQTIEAISHARAAETPIILAINKMDKPDADPSRVRNELLQHELVVESMGGDILEIEVSALKKTGLEKLEEAILLQSEVMELRANPDRPADGVVIEAKLDKGRGPLATVLVQRGTLRRGDIIVSGAEWGKVRALINDAGDQVSEAGPTVPVEVLGLNGVPDPGDLVVVVDSEARAREICEYRQRSVRDSRAAKSGKRSLEQMMSQLKDDERQELAVVVKADVQGSVEAIVSALEKLSTDDVACRVVHSGVGAISETDISLAEASNAALIGFNVRANAQARQAAEAADLELRYYSVIYDVVDDVKAVLSGMLAPELRESFLGYAEILEVFNISKVGKVAGCRVTEGQVKRGSGVRLLRDEVVIHEGKLKTLKRFKDEVAEVQVGQECGMAFENYQDIQPGDVIECFDVQEIERTL